LISTRVFDSLAVLLGQQTQFKAISDSSFSVLGSVPRRLNKLRASVVSTS
jgi:hypothetical protein